MKWLSNSRQLALQNLAAVNDELLRKKKKRDAIRQGQLHQSDGSAPELGNFDELISETEDDVGMWER